MRADDVQWAAIGFLAAAVILLLIAVVYLAVKQIRDEQRIQAREQKLATLPPPEVHVGDKALGQIIIEPRRGRPVKDQPQA